MAAKGPRESITLECTDCKRRNYMTEILGIPISEEVLPLSGLCGYLRPYLLARGKALYLRKS